MHRHVSARVSLFLILLFVCGIVVGGCGGDDDGGTPNQPPSPTSVGGNSNKAPIAGASVNIHSLNADASVGAFLAGPFTTNASGNWSGTIPAGTSGSLVMVSTGGSYTDEATGSLVTLAATDTLYGVLQGTSSAVTPLTHATFLTIRALVAGGTPLSNAITLATNTAVAAFGFSFSTTIPNAAGTPSAVNYAYLMGGLSRLLNANPALSAFAGTPPFDLVVAMAADMTDGKLNGLDASGAPIQVFTDASHTTTAPLPALSAGDLSAWLTQANAYAGSTVFNVNIVWNPYLGKGGVGGNLGSVDYTGAVTGTTVPNFATTAAGGTWMWFADVNDIEIRIVLANQALYPDKVQTVYFIYNNGAQLWTAHGASGLDGVTIAGAATTFTDMLVVDINNLNSQVRITGTLTNPVTP